MEYAILDARRTGARIKELREKQHQLDFILGTAPEPTIYKERPNVL